MRVLSVVRLVCLFVRAGDSLTPRRSYSFVFTPPDGPVRFQCGGARVRVVAGVRLDCLRVLISSPQIPYRSYSVCPVWFVVSFCCVRGSARVFFGVLDLLSGLARGVPPIPGPFTGRLEVFELESEKR